ncbi:hypothetical protein ILUMI_23697, partial [Ignelater luminosus]
FKVDKDFAPDFSSVDVLLDLYGAVELVAKIVFKTDDPYPSLQNNHPQTEAVLPKIQLKAFSGDLYEWPIQNYQREETIVCLNCFSIQHQLNACKSKEHYSVCRIKHHTLLHFNKAADSSNNNNSMFTAGGFQIVKWCSNSKEFLVEIPVEDCLVQPNSFDDNAHNVLGLQWQPSIDAFSFKVNTENSSCTKRNNLSIIIAPVTLYAKLLIKKLWSQNLNWDSTPPSNIVTGWTRFCSEIHLESLQISRQLGVYEGVSISLIRFADASGQEYRGERRNDPADCLSRGLTPFTLINHQSWLSGPDWLISDNRSWPIRQFTPDNSSQLEETTCSLPVVITNETENPLYSLILKFSSWSKLLNRVAYVLRFLKLLPKNDRISVTDLEKVEFTLLSLTQSVHFKEEYSFLKKGLYPTSIKNLCPFIVDNSIRVGGRFRNANLTYHQQHPILLPKRNHLVSLVIDYTHLKNLHTGSDLVVSISRQRYWMLAACSVVKQRLRQSNLCFKVFPRATYPLIADLPALRVVQAKPFVHTGIDDSGQFYAFNRFLARKGPCSIIYSDNGTNFIGAKASLDEIYKFVKSKRYNDLVQIELAQQRIEWKFILPKAPHMGGIRESQNKSVKAHLRKVEALLNSSPL